LSCPAIAGLEPAKKFETKSPCFRTSISDEQVLIPFIKQHRLQGVDSEAQAQTLTAPGNRAF
jgi:hypothetical protein